MNFAVIASGPSLTAEDCERVRGYQTITVNSSFRMTPWADVLYACDPEWWSANIADVDRLFHGERWTQSEEAAKKYGLGYIKSERKPGLGRTHLHQGANSGYQAINLAYLWGAKRIVLLGFDMSKDHRRTHWHAPHPHGMDHPYELWRMNMESLAADLVSEGVSVVNCSRRSDLKCFDRMSIEDAILEVNS